MQCESSLRPFCLLPSVLLAWERILAIYRQQLVLVGVRIMVVAVRTKVGEGNDWKKWELAFISRLISFIYCFLVFCTCFLMCEGKKILFQLKRWNFRGQKRDFVNDQRLIEAPFRLFIWCKELVLGKIRIWR
ncbi:hypothetical protein E2C01_021020 [Portunus trituberculatus]|uniref:Transmembrane protein n=1 Tax=Portunus trituberculatus TaxID=210409 RepID=A0A5B7E4Z0_PORTR|nr:hypothetical protein [Portunus trituberculatus]